MKDDKKNEEDPMNRRSLLTLASIASLAIWHKPVINSVMLPAHAQTSCTSPAGIIGNWRFTDQNNVSVDIEFVDESNMIFNNRGFTNPWQYSESHGSTIFLDIRNPRAPWEAMVTQETNCVASEITINLSPTDAGTYSAPLIGNRI